MNYCAPRSLFSSLLGTALILQGVLVPVNAESRLSALESPESHLLGLDLQPILGSSRERALHFRREQNSAGSLRDERSGGSGSPERASADTPAGRSYIERQLNGALQMAGERLSGVFSNKQQFSSVLKGIKDGDVDLRERLLLTGQEHTQLMLDAALDRFEQRFQKQSRVLHDLELSYRAPFAGREGLFHANATLALWENSGNLLFGQGGLVVRDGEEGANIGLGYRFMAGPDLLLGANTFYDYLSDPGVERWSLGAEARSSWLDLHGNWYQGRGSDRDGDILYYSPDGWDVELAAHLPQAPWVELGASYYLWDGEGGQDDLEGQRYRLSLKPSTLLSMDFEYDDPDEGDGSWGVEFGFNYQFGVSLSRQLDFIGQQGTPDLWSRRYEKVEREYAIRVRERRAAAVPPDPAVTIERIARNFDRLFPGPLIEQMRLPTGRFYELPPPATDFTDYFMVTEDLPGSITFTVNRDSETEATLTLTYTRPTPPPPTTPTGTIRITALDTGLTGNDGDLSNQLTIAVSGGAAAAPTTPRPLIGRLLPFSMTGCSADACVVPATGAGMSLPPLQFPVTSVEASTCATCQVSLAFDLEFGGTAVYGDDYMVTGLTLTPTRDTAVSLVTIPLPAAPTPPATASAPFMVTLTSLSTHYLNVILTLTPDDDREREEIQLVYVDRGDDNLIDDEDDRGTPQTVLTLEPAGTLLPSASVAETPLTERSLVVGTATAAVTLIDSEYVAAGALDAADFTLTANVPGTVTVAGVTRTNATVATLTLRHEGADISVNGTLNVIVEASAHTGAVALYADGSVPIMQMSGDATLSGLTVTPGTLTPPFAAATTGYTLNVASTVTDVMLTPTAADAAATLSVSGSTVASGSVTTISSLTPGGTRVVPIVVTAADGRPMTYQVTITNAPDLIPTFGSQTVAAQRYTLGVNVGTVQLPTATGGDGALSYTLTPALPNGLSFDATNRQISGTPTATVAATPYTLTATDSDATSPDQATLSFPITVSVAGPLAAVLTASPALTEANLDGAMVRVTLMNTLYVDAASLNASGFMLSENVAGDVTVSGVVRDSDTVATLTLAHDGTDLSADGTLGVTVLAAAHASSGNLVTGTVSITFRDDIAPMLSTATVNRDMLMLVYDEALNETPLPDSGDYTVMVGGSAGPAVSGVAINDRTVLLTLASMVTSAQGVTLDYTPGSNPVEDVNGNDVAALDDRVVTNNTLPFVISVALSSNPGADETYAIGEIIEATLTFNEIVTVVGIPSIAIGVGATDLGALFAAGSGTTQLAFRRTVEEGNADTDGVSISANSYLSRGGTIQGATGVNADLVATPGRPDQSGHRVDGVRPVLDSATVDGDMLVLTYNKALDTASTPANGAYTVEVDSSAGPAVTGVTISGMAVTLTLATAVPGGLAVTLDYTTGTTTVQDTVGNDAVMLDEQTVMNNTPGVEPSISITAGTAVTEGANATFMLTADSAPVGDLTVTVTVTETGNFIASPAPTTVTIADGATTATLEVPTMADLIDEANGMITAMVEGGAGYTVDGTNNSASVTVNDDDEPTLAIDSPSVAEGDSGSTTLTYIVTLTGETEQEVTVDYADATSGTATSGTDYTAITGGTLTFASGTTTQNIDVTVTGDTDDEPNDTVILRLSNPVNATITNADGTGTITNDDSAVALPSISITAGTAVTEGANATFMLTADSAPVGDLTVTVTVTETGNFIASPAPTTVTIADGATTATLEVPTMADLIDEANGMITAMVEGGAGYTVDGTNNSASVTVNDDDEPTLAIDSPSVAEGDSGSTTLTYIVTLTGETEQEVTVDYADATSGTATSGTDYTAITGGTLTFASGTTTQNIDVTVTGDTDDEPNDTVILRLSNPVNATITNADGTGTITNDDSAVALPSISITAGTAVTEGANATFMLTADSAPVGDLTVTVTVTETGNFIASPAPTTVTIADGATTATLEVPTMADLIDEANGMITAMVEGGAGYTVDGTNNSASVTVNDDDEPTLAIDSPSVAEGDSGSTTLTYIVTLTGETEQEVTVDYADATSGTATSGTDYTAITGGTLTFASGTTTQNIDVTVTGDTDDEPNDTVILRLSNPVNATITNADGTGTITNDDSAVALPSISITAGTAVTEGANATFMLTADSAPVGDLTVTVTVTETGNFIASPAPTTVTIADGATTATLEVPTMADLIDEANGMITAMVEGGAGYTVDGTNNSASVTVNDDDEPTLAIDSPSVAEGDSGSTTLTYIVTLTGETEQEVTVDYADTTSGTATSGTDYTAITGGTLTFASGTTTQNIDVTVTGDTDDEPNDTVIVRLSNPVNATITNADGTGTITNDDSAVALPSISITAGTAVTEGANATFMLTADSAPVGDLTVTVTVTETGNFIASPAPTTVTIADGATTATLEVPTMADLIDEANGMITAMVEGGAGYTVDGTNNSASVTVNDDDEPTLAIDSPSVAEGDSGSTTLTYIVTLTGETEQEVTVDYADATSGTATSGTDYTAITGGTLTFASGTTTQNIDVTVTGDTDDEPNDTVILRLSNPVNATITNADGTGTITNDDGAPVVGPTVSGVAITTIGPYGVDGVIDVTVTFSEEVIVTGTPQITLTVGTATRQAAYISGTGTPALVFTYTVVSGDSAPDGVSIAADALAQAGGSTIQNSAGNDAALNHDPVVAVIVQRVQLGLMSDPSARVIAPVLLTESNLNGATLEVRLTGTEYMGESELGADDFTLSLTGVAGVTVGSVTRDTTTSATLMLAYDDTAITVDGSMLGVMVLDAGHTGSGILDAGTVPITNEAPSSDATLANLMVLDNNDVARALNPDFNPTVTDYTITAESAVTSVTVSPTVTHRRASFTVDTLDIRGSVLFNVDPASIALVRGEVLRVTINVVAEDGSTGTYSVAVTRLLSAPVLESLSVNGDTLTLRYSQSLDESPQPSAMDFTVQADGNPVDIDSALVAGQDVTLTLATAVTPDQTVTLSYMPGTNPLQGPDPDNTPAIQLVPGDEPVSTLTNEIVENITPSPPMFLRATVNTNNPMSFGTLVLIFDAPLVGNQPPPASYTVTVGGAGIDVASVEGITNEAGEGRVSLVGFGFVFGVEYTVTYTSPSMNPLAGQDPGNPLIAGVPVEDFTETFTPPSDTAGVTVSETMRTVAEEGGTATYTVVLNNQPTADVTITPASSDTLAATVSPTSLTFTTTDWDTAQTVTVTGVNDTIDNPSDQRTATVTHAPSSTDGNYNSVIIASVTVTVEDDDDAVGGTVSVGLDAIATDDIVNIAEQATGFTISGTVADGAMVGVTLAGGSTRNATVSTTTWTLDIPANDGEITGTSVVVLATATLSGGTGTVSRTIDVDLVAPTATYAPPPALTVGTAITAIMPGTPSADISNYALQASTLPPGLTLDGNSGVISGAPTTANAATAPVTIRLTDTASNIVDLAPITFPMVAMGSQTLDGFAYSAGTATVGQTAPTVTAPSGVQTGSTLSYSTTSAGICTVDTDTGALTLVGAGDCVITVTASATANYNEATAESTITVSVAAAGVTVTPATLSVPEDGGEGTYTVVLDTAPTDDVTIAVASDTDTAATVSSASLTFTPTNWNTAQTVTVTGVNDDVDNPSDERTATVTHVPTSTDVGYGSVVIASVTVTVTDDDTANFNFAETDGGTMVAELGGTDTYTVELATEPTHEVTIAVVSGDRFLVTVSSPSLTFTTANWNTAQTVTVTGVNDDVDFGSTFPITVTHTAASTDGNYEGLSRDVVVTVTDDDTAGVTVSETTRTVAEDGGMDTYTVVLNTQPNDNVTITPASSDPDVAIVSAALTFTSTTWDTPQTFTVTGVDDSDVNTPDRTATVSHTSASGDSPYQGLTTILSVLVTATDDDAAAAAGVTVTPTAFSVPEDGGTTADYTLVLDTAPTANVTIAVASDTDTAATVSSASLTFTPTDWDTAQTVTVTGVNDDVPGDRTATVSHTAASTDGNYEGVAISIASVTVTVNDDDAAAAGVTVTPTAFSVPEDGGTTADYTLVLDTAPTADVTIAVASDTVTAATVSSASLTFSTTDWNTAQTVTVTGVNDDVDNPSDERTASLSHTATSTDGDYEGVAIASVTVTVTDDDDAGVTVDPLAFTIDEAGSNTTADYTVVLDTAPTADVTIAVASDTVTAATVSSATLTFTPTNWDTAQTVTVTGVNDDVPGDRTATVSHTAASTDGNYEGGAISIASVTVTVNDDDAVAAGVTVTPTAFSVPEDGGTTADYTVVLDTAPTANVTIAVASDTDTAATVSSASLTFTPTDWDTAQTVTVTGVNDDVPGDRTATVSHTAASTDGNYEGVAISIASVTVTVTDDDAVAAGVTVTPETLSVPEDGGTTVDYTLVLDTAPTADVTIAVASDTVTAATVSSASLTFTPANWNTAQTVTVTGVNDDVDNPSDERTASLSHTATSTDGDYEGVAITIASVTVTVTDDDDAGVTVDPLAFTVDEAGSNTTADYTLVLDTAPTADVTIAVASDTVTAATVSSATLTFTPTNWNTAQTVTVTGVNDDVPGDRTATVTHTAASTDGNYEGVAISIASVTVTVNDDDAAAAGVTVTPETLSVPEDGGEGTYTLVLDTAPTADVTIAVASDTVTAATVSSASLTFTPTNWNTAQTVTVTGVNDDVPGDRTATVTHTPTSTDGNYDGGAITIASVTVTVEDDDGLAARVTAPVLLTESNLNGATLEVTLTGTEYMGESELGADDFTLSLTSVAGVTVGSVSRDSPTTATLTLDYGETPIDVDDSMLGVMVLAAGHTGSGILDAGAVPIINEPTSSDATLAGLMVLDDSDVARALNPDFDGSMPATTYAIRVENAVRAVTVSPTVTHRRASVTVDTAIVVIATGAVQSTLSNATGRIDTGTVRDRLEITINVIAEDDSTETYRVDVTRLPAAPVLESLSVNGDTLALRYTLSLDAGSQPSTMDFTVQAGGNPVDIASVLVAGRDVTLTLVTAVTLDQTVTLSYTPDINPLQGLGPDNTPAIRLVPGDEPVSTLTNEMVMNETPPPAVAPVFDRAEVLGIRMRLIFNMPMHTAGGVPEPDPDDFVVRRGGMRIPVAFTGVENNVASEGQVDLFFDDVLTPGDYTVSYTPRTNPLRGQAPGDPNAPGAAVAPLVDVAITVPGAVVLPEISIAAGTAVTEGTAAEFTLTASSPAPVGGLTVTVSVSQTGTFIEGVAPTTVTIAAAATTAALMVTTTDDDIDEAAGSVTATVTAGTGYTVGTGNTASVTVNDDDAEPTLAIDSPSVAEGDAGDTPTLSYTVTLTGDTEQEVTVDYADTTSGTATSGTDYETITAGTLTFAPGTTTQNIDVTVMGDADDEGDGETVILTLSGETNATITTADGTGTITDDDGAPVVAPTVSTVEISSTGPYALDEDIEVTVTFSEAVTVDTTGGTPQIPLVVGVNTRQAAYTSGSTTAALVFTYTVVAAETDADGVSIVENTLSENGGTIQNSDSTDANLDHPAVAPDTAHAVDTTAPAVSMVEISSTGPYALDEDIEVTVTFSEAVTVSGTPEIILMVGASTSRVTFLSGSGSTALVFTYTVQAGDSDTDGVGIDADALAQAGGSTIQDAAGNDATLTHIAVDEAPANAVDTTAPAVDTVEISSDGPYGVDGVIDVTVTFDEAVTVSGTPEIALTVGTTTRQATAVSGTGTAALVFSYTVVAGENDDNGVSIAVNALAQAGGSTIQDAAGNDAALAHDAVVAALDQVVDTTTSGPAAQVTAPVLLTESNLNGATLEVTLTGTEYMGESALGADDFTLSLTSVAGVTVGSVSRDSPTTATLTLAYDETPIDVDGSMLGVMVLADGHTGSGILDAGSVSITNEAPSSDATLAGLMVLDDSDVARALNPAFDPTVTDYAITVERAVLFVRVRPTVTHRRASFTRDVDTLVEQPERINLNPDVPRMVTINVTAEDGASTGTYSVTLTRLRSAPVLERLSVNGDTLTLRYSRALDTGSQPSTTDFTVQADGGTVNIDSVVVAGATVTLTLATAVTPDPPDQMVTLSYTPGANPVRDSLNGRTAIQLVPGDEPVTTLTNEMVRNDTPPPAVAPVLVSTTVIPVFGGAFGGFQLVFDATLVGGTGDFDAFTITQTSDGMGFDVVQITRSGVMLTVVFGPGFMPAGFEYSITYTPPSMNPLAGQDPAATPGNPGALVGGFTTTAQSP